MATDWMADLTKHVSNVDEAAAAGLLKTYRLVLSKPDTAYVAYSDKSELETVRTNFLKKKLSLAQSDADLDAGIAAVGEKLKGVNRKSRLVVYYLLADHFGKLDMFR